MPMGGTSVGGGLVASSKFDSPHLSGTFSALGPECWSACPLGGQPSCRFPGPMWGTPTLLPGSGLPDLSLISCDYRDQNSGPVSLRRWCRQVEMMPARGQGSKRLAGAHGQVPHPQAWSLHGVWGMWAPLLGSGQHLTRPHHHPNLSCILRPASESRSFFLPHMDPCTMKLQRHLWETP